LTRQYKISKFNRNKKNEHLKRTKRKACRGLRRAHRKIVAESHDFRAVDYAERALIDAKSN